MEEGNSRKRAEANGSAGSDGSKAQTAIKKSFRKLTLASSMRVSDDLQQVVRVAALDDAEDTSTRRRITTVIPNIRKRQETWSNEPTQTRVLFKPELGHGLAEDVPVPVSYTHLTLPTNREV